MKLFIGIELPGSFAAEAARVQAELIRLSQGGRFVPESNLHITLHYIGESGELAEAAAAMREAVRGIRPFELHLGHYGCLGRGKGGRISILNVLGDEAELGCLYESLQSALADRGFARERRRFLPHVTLGRSVQHTEEAGGQLEQLPVNATMRVGGITLFESVRSGKTTKYLPLHRERF